jgi:hypothetical protein
VSTKRKRKVNKLSDLSIDEVSLVDRGANQHAAIVLSKRLEEEDDMGDVEKMDPDPTSADLGDTEDELEGDVEERDEDGDIEKGFLTRLVEKFFTNGESTTSGGSAGTLADMSDVEKALPGQDPRFQFGAQQSPPMVAPPMQQAAPAPGPQNMQPGAQAFPAGPEAMPGQMQAGPPLPAEVVQYIQQLEQALADAQGQTQPSGTEEEDDVNPFGKSLDGLDDDELGFLQELSKSLESEDQREQVAKALELVEKANERAEAAEEVAKAERDFRLNQEYVAKARAYTNLPVSAEEFGPVLKKLHESLDEDELGLVTKALSAANESTANFFGEIGKRGTEAYETVSKVDSQAAEIAKNENITIEAARERVFESNPRLYDEYLAESGR